MMPTKPDQTVQQQEAQLLREIFEKRQELSSKAGIRLTQVSVGKRCGWSSPQSVMSQLLGGRVAISLETLLQLSQLLGFKPEEVSARHSETIKLIVRMHKEGLLNPVPQIDGYRLPVTSGSVPVMFKAAVAGDGSYTGGYSVSGKHHGLLNIFSDDADAYAVMILGNALAPRVRSHEFLVVEPGRDAVSGDDVLVNMRDGSTKIREFIFNRDGQYRFDSITTERDSLFIDESLVHSIHYVDAIVKKTRFEPS
jgi:phage repressor protein C with HTH and peptisase S24 domain